MVIIKGVKEMLSPSWEHVECSRRHCQQGNGEWRLSQRRLAPKPTNF